jgi:REP element-mobilizing transposase RayT
VRGNARQVVFIGSEDYGRFLEQMKDALEEDQVVLYAYVLMPNHFHLLVETPLGNVQRFMQRLNTAYGMYYRYKHDKAGHCFQGRYGAKVVKGDEYLLRLTRYIHLNPVKVKRFTNSGPEGKRRNLESYRWSSYRGYAGLGTKEDMVNYRWLRLMGRITEKGNQKAYRRYMEETLGLEDRALKDALGQSAYAIGDKEFIEEAEEDIKAARYSKVDTGDIVWPEKPRKGLEEVIGPVLKVVNIDADRVVLHGRAVGEKKMLVIELLCRLSCATQREVGSRLGYRSETAVGKQRLLLRGRIKRDAAFRKLFESLEKKAEKELNASF